MSDLLNTEVIVRRKDGSVTFGKLIEEAKDHLIIMRDCEVYKLYYSDVMVVTSKRV